MREVHRSCTDFVENLTEIVENQGRHDEVSHPAHYTAGRIEAIDVIEDALSPEQYEGYLRGNALKYLLRYPLKGGSTDLRKAATYLEWLVGVAEARELAEAAS